MGEMTVLPPVARPAQQLSVVSRAFDFSERHEVPPGLTLREMMDFSGITSRAREFASVWIHDPVTGGSVEIGRAYWHLVRPKPGMEICIRFRPGKGGGGGKSGMGIMLSVLLMVAVAAVTWGVGAALTPALGAVAAGAVGSLAGGLVGMVGKLAINALVPPPQQSRAKLKDSGSAGRSESPAYSITGTQNQVNPLGPLARIFGKTRHWPVYGALPYTESLGTEQWIRLLFSFGYGPLQFDEASFKIGETPITEFQGVQYVIHPNYQGSGLELYTNDVDETNNLAIEIANDGIRTPAVAASQTLTFSNNPTNGETFTVSGRTYTLLDTLTATANRIKIGSTLVETLDNIVAAINRSGGDGTLYSAATAQNTVVSAAVISTTALRVTARETGAAGNAVSVADTFADGSWGAGNLAGGADAVLIPSVPLVTEYGTLLELTEDEKWYSQTTGEDVNETSFDLAFPEGLVHFQQDSNEPITRRITATVRFDVRYREAGSSDPWTYVGTQARNTLTCSAQPGNGETVTIAGKVYTFQTSLTNVDGNVYRGADLTEALDNLKAAVNLEAGSGTLYAAAMTENGSARATSATATRLNVEAKHLGHRTGPDGQALTASETLANGSWASTNFTGGTYALKVTGANEFLRAGKRIVHSEPGQFEFQWRRLNAGQNAAGVGQIGATTIRDKAVLTVLRAIRYIAPVNKTGTALVEMRIKADGQLQQVINAFNCIVTSMHPIPSWDDEEEEWVWSEPVATRNPAWHALEVLRGSANKKPVPDAQIYLPDFIDWAAACDETGTDGTVKFTCDGIFDFVGTVGQTLQDIGSVGRASIDGNSRPIRVIRDVAQTVPAQMFTPRNSWGFRGRIVFSESLPHGIRIRFRNEEKGYAQDEVIAYADGYDKNNATEFEVIDEPLCVRPRQNHKAGRYNQGAAKLRPIEYTLNSDPEWFEVRRGQLVKLQHDAIRVGQVAGRIKARIIDEGDPDAVLGFTLDETMTMSEGTLYGIEWRGLNSSGGTTWIEYFSVVTNPGRTNTVDLLMPLSLAGDEVPAVGDLLTFGEANRTTIRALVKSIVPDSRMNARITFLDEAPDLLTVDASDEIPDYNPGTTPLPPLEQRKPQQPTIAAIKSDETVMALNPDGSFQAVIAVHFSNPSGGTVPVSSFAARYRVTGTDGAWLQVAPKEANLGSVVLSPVDEGLSYDIEVWSISIYGEKSRPLPLSHTVVGKSTPPPDPIDARITDGKLIWGYPEPKPVDWAGYRVYLNAGGVANWPGASIKVPGLVTGNEFVLPVLVRGTYAVMVKAVDRGGNESDGYSLDTLIVGDPVFRNIVETFDISGGGFTGTKTNGTVVSDVLTADISGEAWSSDPTSAAWPSDPDAPAWAGSAMEMTYVHEINPGPDSIGGQIRIDAVITGASWAISYSTDDVTYLPWPGQVTVVDGATYYLKIVTAGGGAAGEIEELQVYTEVPDETEHLDNVAISSGGTRLDIAKAYLSIRNINPVIRKTALETATGIHVEDYAVTIGAGPLVFLTDPTGAYVDGHCDFDPVGAKNMNP